MAEELADIMQKFVLSEKELGGTALDLDDVDKGIKECQHSLVGKIVGEKIVNFVGVKNFANLAWGYPRGMVVMVLGPNMFQFIIPSTDDRERILDGGPWIFDSRVLVMEEWYEGVEEDERAFRTAPLWVQAWNLPVHWISKEVGWKIGSIFQEVKEVIVPQVGGKEGRHLKLLVLVDITSPLLRGTTVKLKGALKWISFKYERCPDFCYRCGIIGHSERNCKVPITVEKSLSDNQYGPWLRANWGKGSPRKGQNAGRGRQDKVVWGFKDGELVPNKTPEPIQGKGQEKTGAGKAEASSRNWRQTRKENDGNSFMNSQTPASENLNMYKLNIGGVKENQARVQEKIHSSNSVEQTEIEEQGTNSQQTCAGKGVDDTGATDEIMEIEGTNQEKKQDAVQKMDKRIKRQLKSPVIKRLPHQCQ
ncbi:uncharacterized protein [Coffea arabica]|uniref:CCHC-type domain-containing protein n=1 Tax=Coffea arabica TaxID=13443 RepID=A0A6P6S4L7_COFAR|nr:uncharacterized protein LOC113687766 [Coffea arabica]